MSSMFSKMNLNQQKNILEMLNQGKDYLWQLFQGPSVTDQDLNSFSYKDSKRYYEKRYGPLLLKEEILEKEVAPPCLQVPGKRYEIPTVRKTEELPVDAVPSINWYLPRVQMTSPATYASDSLYHDDVVLIHKMQMSRIREAIGDVPVIEFGARTSYCSTLWTSYEGYDLYPKDKGVQAGDMNNLMHKIQGRVVLMQYSYVFCTAATRSILRNEKYVVIEEDSQPVWLRKAGTGLWSNVITSLNLFPDREHTKTHSLMFSENLLSLEGYQVFVENDHVSYLRSMGREPSEGPVVIGSLREAAMYEDHFPGTPFYYASEGRISQVQYPYMVGTMMVGDLQRLWLIKGEVEYKGPHLLYGEYTLLVPSKASITVRDSCSVVQYTMQAPLDLQVLDENITVLRSDEKIIFETNSDLIVYDTPPTLQDVLYSDEELTALSYINCCEFPQSVQDRLYKQGLIEDKDGDQVLTEKALLLPTSRTYFPEFTLSVKVPLSLMAQLELGNLVHVSVAQIGEKSRRVILVNDVLSKIVSIRKNKKKKYSIGVSKIPD